MIYNKLYFISNKIIIPTDISKKYYNRVLKRIAFMSWISYLLYYDIGFKRLEEIKKSSKNAYITKYISYVDIDIFPFYYEVPNIDGKRIVKVKDFLRSNWFLRIFEFIYDVFIEE